MKDHIHYAAIEIPLFVATPAFADQAHIATDAVGASERFVAYHHCSGAAAWRAGVQFTQVAKNRRRSQHFFHGQWITKDSIGIVCSVQTRFAGYGGDCFLAYPSL